MRAKELPSHVKVYGLTGGIASGKSSVSQFFQEAGIPVVDADQIAKEVTAAGSPGEKIYLELFNTTDRASIREKIIASKDLKKKLEEKLHPIIRTESFKKILALIASGAKTVIYDAALLIEANRHTELDGVILVTAPKEDRVKRLVARDKISQESAIKIIDSQLSDAEKKKYAKWIIENNATLDTLKKQVITLANSLQNPK